MKLLETFLCAVERAHGWLAGRLVRLFSALWRLQSRIPTALRFAVGFTGLALVLLWAAHLVSGGYVAQREWDEAFVRYLENAGHIAGGDRLHWACLAGAALCVVASVFAFIRRRFAFRVMEAAMAAYAALSFLAFVWIMKCGPLLNAADSKAFSTDERNGLWVGVIFWSLMTLPWAGLLLLALVQRSIRVRYGFKSPSAWGEGILDSLRTGGADRRWRSSIYYALTIFFVLLFGPYLVFLWGWEEPYSLPKGGGEQVFQEVVVKKVQKKKKPKKLTVNPWSPYILERMNIDDVVTLQELEQETRDTYVAQQKAVNKGGKGKGTGGWPEGVENSAIRFIRLQYRGGDWDQDMGKGADYNLLIRFHEWTGMKIAKDTESREIMRLKLFPKKKAPPFVFMTGMKGISISDAEAKALREYCQREGGMLFIDNGGGSFDGAVRNMLRKVFPGKSLRDVPNDDPIHQRPYMFPDGAPPFWHHAGYRAMGIRDDDGRLMVYYHPGDVNDAWKDGHSGASPEVADQAYKLGVNVMFYAFNQYYRRHYGDD